MAPAKHVEGADQIDVDHRLEGVGAHAECGGQEVARRARNHEIHRAQLVVDALHRRAGRAVIAHVGGQRQRTDAVCGSLRLFWIAPQYRDFGTQLGEPRGDPQVDPRGPSRDERHFALEQVFAEWTGH